MLRIGQFSDTFLPVVDGVGRVVQAYAETLSAMGHQVTVVAPMYDTGSRGGFPFELLPQPPARTTQPQITDSAMSLFIVQFSPCLYFSSDQYSRRLQYGPIMSRAKAS